MIVVFFFFCKFKCKIVFFLEIAGDRVFSSSARPAVQLCVSLFLCVLAFIIL